MIGPAEIEEMMAEYAEATAEPESGSERPANWPLFVSDPSTGHNGAATVFGIVRDSLSPSCRRDVVPL